MVNSLFGILGKQFNFVLYRFRYLINYIIIGFFSIVVEILFIYLLRNSGIPHLYKLFMGFALGLFFSFILNARINFKVPKNRNVRTFIIFSVVATIAFALNLILIRVFKNVLLIDYSYLRFITAGIVFLLSYTAHRKITFDFVKKVGIAVYLNKGENIAETFSKIRYYSDFIHLDLVDKTFSKDAKEIDLSLIRQINNTWVLKKFIHLMSRKPSQWVNKLWNTVDVFLFHLDIDESLDKLLDFCKSRNKKVGLVIQNRKDFEDIEKYLNKIDFVQVMGIQHLGSSGQSLSISTLRLLRDLNKIKQNYGFEIIFDGGVKTTNIHKINAKYIVSSSGILKTKKPVQSFMELKTSSRYTSVDKKLKRNIFLGIRKTVESMDFVESGSIVGSFSEGTGLEGLNDIDIVVILDKLTKKKFQIVLDRFELLKKEIEARYGYPVYINNTLGPLKFNEDCIVFHLMIYDIQSHKDHCIKSPFTCFDWQRSKLFIKKPMHAIYKVWDLQLKNFFGSRRGADEYLSEIKQEKLSYRVYQFKGDKVIEEKKYKQMNNRDKIEFAYHITKFLSANFLKVYYFKNQKFSEKELFKRYFSIFPMNKELHEEKIKYISNLKKKENFIEVSWITKWLEVFINDFEYQFREMFELKK